MPYLDLVVIVVSIIPMIIVDTAEARMHVDAADFIALFAVLHSNYTTSLQFKYSLLTQANIKCSIQLTSQI